MIVFTFGVFGERGCLLGTAAVYEVEASQTAEVVVDIAGEPFVTRVFPWRSRMTAEAALGLLHRATPDARRWELTGTERRSEPMPPLREEPRVSDDDLTRIALSSVLWAARGELPVGLTTPQLAREVLKDHGALSDALRPRRRALRWGLTAMARVAMSCEAVGLLAITPNAAAKELFELHDFLFELKANLRRQYLGAT